MGGGGSKALAAPVKSTLTQAKQSLALPKIENIHETPRVVPNSQSSLAVPIAKPPLETVSLRKSLQNENPKFLDRL